MKFPLLLCTLLLFSHSSYASSKPYVAGVAMVTADQDSARARLSWAHHKDLHKGKTLYTKGRGTIGLLSSLVLGPVGYAGVRLFSHNTAVRDKAKLGIYIWIGAAVVTVITIGAIQSRETVGQLFLDFLIGAAGQ